MSDVNRFVP